MWVAMRSRNQRSCEMTSTQPANSVTASSSERRVSTSRSLVGSSSSSTLALSFSILARRSEEHTSELQSLMRISYAVFCLKKKKQKYIDRQRYPLTDTHMNK